MLIIETLFGRGSLLLILGYYWFLNFRYLASGNSRMVFEALGAKLDHFFAHPAIPSLLRRGYHWIRNYLRNSVQMRQQAR